MKGSKPNVTLLVALVTLLVLPSVSLVLLAQEATPTLSANADTFKIGETVSFSGENYAPAGSTYRLNITRGSITYSSLDFVSTSSGGIPEGISWEVSTGVSSGTYLATVYNTTDPASPITYMQEVANRMFVVNAGTLVSDKFEYFTGEPVQFSGSGYTPEGTNYTIEIVLDGALVAAVPFTSSVNGWIPDGIFWRIPFDAGNGTYVTTSYNNTAPSTGAAIASTEFFINATEAGKIGAVTEELTEITDIISSSVGAMNVSLIQKLNATSRKVDQAILWLGEGKTKVAANMLHAAKNTLKAFINQVEAQRGKHIGEEVANQLIEEANAIIAKIDAAMPFAQNSEGQSRAHQSSTSTAAQLAIDGSEPKGKGKQVNKGKGPGNKPG